MLVTRKENTTISVCPGSHQFWPYTDEYREVLVKNLKTSKLETEKYHVIVGCGYMQHAGMHRNSGQTLQYHVYVTPEKYYLKDAVSFLYRNAPVCKKRTI